MLRILCLADTQCDRLSVIFFRGGSEPYADDRGGGGRGRGRGNNARWREGSLYYFGICWFCFCCIVLIV